VTKQSNGPLKNRDCFAPLDIVLSFRGVSGAAGLALFTWLLSLHATAAGRVYAAYGGVYVAVALLWLWMIDGVRPTVWDLAGVAVTLTGMGIIILGSQRAGT
jgi:small multidrug resistance family-3 protein